MNLLDALIKELDSAGVKSDSPEAKKIMSGLQNLSKVDIGDAKLSEVSLLTFEEAKSNPGLQKEHESAAFGKFAAQTEATFISIGKEAGVDVSGLIKSGDGTVYERAAAAAKLIIKSATEKAGKGGGDVKEIKEALEKKLADLSQQREADIAALKGEYGNQVKSLKSRIIQQGIRSEIASGKYGKLNSSTPGFEFILDGIVNKIASHGEYELTQDDNTNNWKVLERGKDIEATKKSDGKPLTLADVITPFITQDLLLKEDGKQQREHRESGNGGGELSAVQKQKLALLKSQ